MWLWYRSSDTALIGPLAWDPPHAVGVVLKSKKKKKITRIKIPQNAAATYAHLPAPIDVFSAFIFLKISDLSSA